MTDKEKYTQKLMDAVGGIDDKYVYEAQNYTPKKRMPGYVAAIIAAAASMFLIIGAALPLTFFSLSAMIKSGNAQNDAEDTAPLYQMTQSMSKAEAKAYESLPEISGAALVWRTADSGYSFVPISESKAETLIASIGEGGEKPAEDDGISVWIRTEKGEYISPELKRSPGNVDCAVFEYSPEIAISDKAARMITDIINERG